MNLQEGQKIGGYEIVGELGQGGMATVYKAYHERLDRFVAIKLMHTTFLQDEDFRARFQREARIVARLENGYIVPIYDYNEHDNVPYLVMKYISGMTLKRRVIKTGLNLEETYYFLSRISEGIDYAHKQGILHRDLKPSNILIDVNDHPYITDFGLARIAEAGSSTISHDMMLGTPFYISPEQAQGSKDLDSRTDIYSLAVILYELITGQVPFQADTPYAIVHGHIYTEPSLPSSINPDLSDAIDRVLDRGLAKKREDRYPTATAMMQAFAAALETHPDAKPLPGSSLYNDLGGGFVADDATLMQADKSHKIRPLHKPAPPSPPVIPLPRGGEAELKVELGDLNWDNIREGLRSGAQSIAEMIEERIDTELRQRKGIELTDEELARRRVLKRLKERQEFIKHLTTYIMVNGFLVGIWFFTGAGFFWPFFPLFFWGIGLVTQGIQYYSKYGPGASNHEEMIQQEVDKELGRMSHVGTTIDKPKKRGDRLSLEDIQTDGGVRLTDEGELTDSFIEEQRKGH
jgi:serine/threonine protein kinase